MDRPPRRHQLADPSLTAPFRDNTKRRSNTRPSSSRLSRATAVALAAATEMGFTVFVGLSTGNLANAVAGRALEGDIMTIDRAEECDQ